jgi:hypothetical protein
MWRYGLVRNALHFYECELILYLFCAGLVVDNCSSVRSYRVVFVVNHKSFLLPFPPENSPFDLGDRIIILPPEAADNPGPTVSWFVEGPSD